MFTLVALALLDFFCFQIKTSALQKVLVLFVYLLLSSTDFTWSVA